VCALAVIRLKNPIERYRQLALGSDVSALSGHGLGPAVIDFVNSRILDGLKLQSSDVLLDIGCGDGSLLHSARVAKRIGVVPTPEEQRRLQGIYPDVLFVVGLAQTLPLKSEVASKIVCNSVLLLLGSEDVSLAALREIARLARPAAIIWIGEIPAESELERFNMYRGNSVLGMVSHQLRHKGLRAFLSSGRSALTGTLQLDSSPEFHAPPERFIRMIESCGLKVESHFKHRRLDQAGKEMESPYRWNYLVTKP
jgi:ubiquinone/menaquinone biosynthesis C-methylase UbiE